MSEYVRPLTTLVRSWIRVDPRRAVAALVLLVLDGFTGPLVALGLKHLTNGVVGRDTTVASAAAAFVAVVAVANLSLGHFAAVLSHRLSELQLVAIDEEVGQLAHGSAGLAQHERPEYADRLDFFRTQTSALYWAVPTLFGSLALVLQVLLTLALLVRLQPLLLFLPLFALPPLLTGRWAQRRLEAESLAISEDRRRAAHLLRLAAQPGAAKEVRVFRLQEELRTRQAALYRSVSRRVVRAAASGAALQLVGHLAFAIAYAGSVYLVVREAVAGHRSVGDVVLAVTLAAQVSAQVGAALGIGFSLNRALRAAAQLLWLRDAVAELEPHRHSDMSPPRVLRSGIEFRGVSFRYPGTDRDVLCDLDIHLPAGATVALVGPNGAGKSTLVKLLCRFYEPTSGRITVDGVDLSRLSPDQWRERLSAAFQDFCRFEFRARETVALGDLPHIESIPRVRAALDRAQALDVVDRLEHGLETELGSSNTQGRELSSGEWQKLALARAMMRTEPLLLVLDEPTAALDAHAEAMLFARYAAVSRRVSRRTGGITILVSHRFATARMADLILVMGDGRIVERGSHEDLVRLGGVYAGLFEIQAAAYRK